MLPYVVGVSDERSHSPAVRNLFLAGVVWAGMSLPAPAVQERLPQPAAGSFAERLEAHHLLGEAPFDVVDDVPPFAFYIQRAANPAPNHVRKIVTWNGPWLAALVEQLRAEVLPPEARVADPNDGPIPIIVLVHQYQYDAYARGTGRFTQIGRRATYDAKLGAVVTAADAKADSHELRITRRRAVLRAACSAVLAQRLPGNVMRVLQESAWVAKGLASHWSSHPPRSKEASMGALGVLDEAALLRVGEVWRDEKSRRWYVPSLEDLFEARNDEGILERARERSGAHGMPDNIAAEFEGRSLQAFDDMSALLLEFLLNGEGGRFEAGARAYLDGLMGGQVGSGMDAFASAFPGDQLAILDESFEAFIRARHAEARPRAGRLPESGRARAFHDDPRTGIPIDLPALSAKQDERDAREDHALWLASEGRLERASRELRALAESDGAAETHSRVLREAERIDGLASLRRQFLDDWKDSQQTLRLEDEGRFETFRLVSHDETAIVVADDVGSEIELAASALDPGELIKLVRQRGFEPAREQDMVYAALITNRERWRKEQQRVLRSSDLDLVKEEDAYAERVSRGASVALIERVAALGLPTSVEQSQEVIGLMEALFGGNGVTEFVERRREVLTALASRSFSLVFDADPLEHLALAVAWEDRGEGQVRLSYDFKHAEQLDDFAGDHDYLAGDRRDAAPLSAEADRPIVEWGVGELKLRGRTCLRHRLALRGPATLRVEGEWRTPDGGEMPESAPAKVYIGMFDDGLGNRIQHAGLGQLTVIDKPASYSMMDGERSYTFFVDEVYRITIRHDGKSRAWSELDDRMTAVVDAGPRNRGGVYLFTHSEFWFVISSVRLEGRLDPQSFVDDRAQWVEQRLAELIGAVAVPERR